MKLTLLNQDAVREQALTYTQTDSRSLWNWPYWTRTLCQSRLWDTHRQTVDHCDADLTEPGRCERAGSEIQTVDHCDADLTEPGCCARAGSEIQIDSGSLWCWPYWTRMLCESRLWDTDRQWITVMLTLLNQDVVREQALRYTQTDSGSLWCWPYWTRTLCSRVRALRYRKTDSGSLWCWPYWTRTLCESRLWDTDGKTVDHCDTYLTEPGRCARAGPAVLGLHLHHQGVAAVVCFTLPFTAQVDSSAMWLQ